MAGIVARMRRAAWGVCCACMLAAPAMAKVHEVRPGEVPRLEPGEGLLLLEVDTDLALTGVDVTPLRESFTSAGFGKVPVGQSVKLFVVRKDKSLTEDALRDFLHDRLTGYKRPHTIEFRDSLPKSNVGKILRRELRDEAQTEKIHA